MKIIKIFIICFFLFSCVDAVKTSTYIDEISGEYYDISQPIKLNISNSLPIPQFVNLFLKRNRSSNKYYIIVRWESQSKMRPGIDNTDSLKIMINNGYFISYSPVKLPSVIKIGVEPYSIEEEAIYEVDFKLLETLSVAQNIDIYLTGKRMSIKAKINSKYQIMHFADFIKLE